MVGIWPKTFVRTESDYTTVITEMKKSISLPMKILVTKVRVLKVTELHEIRSTGYIANRE